ncbi:Uncharacterised protein [Raoultella terrigena]|uniref:Uncharacterized protein n=1 Tax=Raoultella terrigena TaxID=577 RepID=A0A3P8M357_RAOTE|nr:Uncharacterised protein [Raoultella terrigena]
MNHCNLRTRLGCLLIAALLPASALAIDPPARETSRFALKTNYLEQADEGIYELAFDNAHQYVFAAVTDRVNREANRGYLYAFNPTSLKIEHRYEMPYRAFSLAMNQPQHRLYIGHTQSASLRISMLDTATGKLTKTSDRLSFKTPNAADSRSSICAIWSTARMPIPCSSATAICWKTAQGTQPLHKLLMLDGTTLALKGEVKEAYKGTAYGAGAR